ncbi:hypothetical protein Y1Q_0015243 [Alligator mississippiensis]|uniref:Uncharacterized protein n=1 Tax=Alligator mississippiensis TaxID=8496 RepID=A0A151NL72_ALLMI|nr:hypothetical protein Y1Q_0015243 [Alligator mississippiensis]
MHKSSPLSQSLLASSGIHGFMRGIYPSLLLNSFVLCLLKEHNRTENFRPERSHGCDDADSCYYLQHVVHLQRISQIQPKVF